MRNLMTILLLFSVQTIFAQNKDSIPYRDTVFWSIGDTMIGKITINKEDNKYLFVNDTLVETALDPKQITRFVFFPKEDENEKVFYYSIIGEFYLLETNQDDIITMYATQTYKAVENDGPKYYTVKKKYCLFKNKIIYFPEKGIFKDIMLFLTKDCYAVNNKIKKNELGLIDLPTIVAEYNHCGKK